MEYAAYRESLAEADKALKARFEAGESAVDLVHERARVESRLQRLVGLGQ